jgi:hypothetical protein
MKAAQLLSVALGTMLAIGAMVASTASAADPEFVLLPTSKTYKSISGTSVMRSSTATVICASSQSTGEITSMDAVGDVVVHLLGCKEETSGGTCKISSKGLPNEDELILTDRLRGLLGLVHTTEEATSLVGILFEPETGEAFTTFNEDESPCTHTPETSIKGNIASEATPIGRPVSTGSINLFPSAASPNKKNRIQEILILSGLVKPKLVTFGGIEATEETFVLLLSAGEMEVD